MELTDGLIKEQPAPIRTSGAGKKSCECGAVWTDATIQFYCEKCKTFTLPVHANKWLKKERV